MSQKHYNKTPPAPAVTADELLQPFGRFGVRLGLERSQQLLAVLGQPQQRVPII
ncbi:MAG: hypothetical protein HC838_08825, partial [Spirulinaceae cyanobacterium RM2_2_10]|nr:hypothetical protein [Spirulinaceae cyanobacterium RM2_2_10]